MKRRESLFDTLHYDIKYLIAGFMLDFTDDGCDEPNLIDPLIQFIWHGGEVSRGLAGFCWPEVADQHRSTFYASHRGPGCIPPVSLFDAAKRGNKLLMTHILNTKSSLDIYINVVRAPLEGAIKFGYVPHVEWLINLDPQRVVFTRHDYCNLTRGLNEKMGNWIMAQEGFSGKALTSSAIHSGNIPLLKMYLRLGLQMFSGHSITRITHIPMLDWLLANNYIPRPNEDKFIRICKAYLYLTLPFVKWYFSNGCTVTPRVYYEASRHFEPSRYTSTEIMGIMEWLNGKKR